LDAGFNGENFNVGKCPATETVAGRRLKRLAPRVGYMWNPLTILTERHASRIQELEKLVA
jgi:hypothetical protein